MPVSRILPKQPSIAVPVLKNPLSAMNGDEIIIDS
jgi:hypothetical protein